MVNSDLEFLGIHSLKSSSSKLLEIPRNFRMHMKLDLELGIPRNSNLQGFWVRKFSEIPTNS